MNDDQNTFIGVIIAVIALLLLCFGGCWYSSSVQSEAYKRQGVELSTWEIMMGARPIKVIQP